MPFFAPRKKIQSPPLPSTLIGGQLASRAISDSVITTTIFPGDSSPTTTISHKQSSSVPVAAIAGGTAAGVVLAIAAVIVWTWWGRCIKREQTREKRELLAIMEVRENTRRNASSVTVNSASNTPPFSLRKHERKVAFVSGRGSSPGQAPSEYTEKKDTPLNYPATALPKAEVGYTVGSTPNNPSPLSRASRQRELRVPPVPPLPASIAQSKRNTVLQSSRTARPRPTPPNASPMAASNISTEPSSYSTQSGEERQLPRVPPSLMMAALGQLDLRKYASAGYLSPFRFGQNGSDQPSRLSQVSAGSANTQPDEQSEVGYAT